MEITTLDPRIDVSEKDVEAALRRPSDFGYCGDNDEMFHTWALGPVIETRDSDLREKANAASLREYLESDPSLANDWSIVSADHWAVGWVEHLSYRAVEADGKTPTRMLRVLKDWFTVLDAYPVADDSKLSEMEHEAGCDSVRQIGHDMVSPHAPPSSWPEEVWSWLWDHDQAACENRDGHGANPSDAQVMAALEALELLDVE